MSEPLEAGHQVVAPPPHVLAQDVLTLTLVTLVERQDAEAVRHRARHLRRQCGGGQRGGGHRDGGQRGDGQRNGGQRDGGQHDGGQRDGGQHDGGQRDGGQCGGGQHDGGQRDGGQHNGRQRDGSQCDGGLRNGGQLSTTQISTAIILYPFRLICVGIILAISYRRVLLLISDRHQYQHKTKKLRRIIL